MITLGDWLAEEPFGLAMSSGFFGFFAHTGMLEALIARGLRPVHVGGSSAGALVTGVFAAGVPPEELAGVLAALDRPAFWDPTPGLGLLAGRRFDGILRRLLPTARFEACAVPVKISVFDILSRRTTVLAQGDLVHAIRASCAVPGMFHPVWIARRPYWDGGILDRPGLAGMPPGRVLFHHLAAIPPWRRSRPATHALPQRDGLVTLVIDDLPRSGPWQLEAGRRALALARDATLRALDQPIVDGVVRIR
jgi:NTE family protein